MLFSNWLFWLKNWPSSTNSCQGYNYILKMHQRNWWNKNRWCWWLRLGMIWLNAVWIIVTVQVMFGFILRMKKKVFNAISTNTDVFKSFKYKTKLIENTVAQLAPNADNEILENATECIFGHHWNFTCLWFIAK